MNNKGFAISGLIYGLLVIFLILIFSVLGILVGRNSSLNKLKVDAMNTITGKVSVSSTNQTPSLVADFEKVYVNSQIESLGISDYLNIGVKTLSGLSVTNTTSFTLSSTNEFDITYNAVNQDNIIVSSLTKKVQQKNDIIKNFEFTGEKQEIVLGPGVYKMELWGAESGNDNGTKKGSYASGYLKITSTTKLFVYVGGKGTDKLANTTVSAPGGFNNEISCYNGSTGGGATDIRIIEDSIYSKAIIANGGDGTCGNGGTLNNIRPGYIWSETTKDAVSNISDWKLKEKDYFISTTLKDNTETFLSPSGTNEVGHGGNGYARITYIVSYE